jgi:hypothetical protein
MAGRHKSSGSRNEPMRRPKRRPDVLPNVGLFAGYKGDFALKLDDACDLAEQTASHELGDDASGAGEDAVPNDRDDQASEGPVRSPTGRLALRSSRNGEHLRSERRKIDLDDENDVLRRIRDVGARCREPKHYHLGVLLFGRRRLGAGGRRLHGPVYAGVARDAASQAAFASGHPAWIEAAAASAQ